MSSIDQAFVKAFARRQTADVNTAENDVQIPATKRAAVQVQPSRPVERPKTPSMRVDPSVADTTSVWIDPIEDRILKAQHPHENVVPRPRFIDRQGPTSPADGQSPVSPAPVPAGRVSDEQKIGLSVDSATVSFDQATAIDFPSEYAIASFTTDLYAPADKIQRDLENRLAGPVGKTAAPAKAAPAPAASQPVFRFTGIKPHNPKPAPESAGTKAAASPPPVESSGRPAVTSDHDELPADQASQKQPENRIDPAEPADTRSPASVNEPPAEFNAAWEIDALDIPDTVAELFFDDALFESIGDHLARAVDGGLRSALVASDKAGEGRSTVALGIALAAAAAGVKVLLVDADFADPTLADGLRLDLDRGWDDAANADISFDEVGVFAGEDQITLLPLLPAAKGESKDADDLADKLERLIGDMSRHFDLVIIDGGVGGAGLPRKTETIESAFIVRDAQATSADEINALAKRLMRAGVRGIGVIENFVQD